MKVRNRKRIIQVPNKLHDDFHRVLILRYFKGLPLFCSWDVFQKLLVADGADRQLSREVQRNETNMIVKSTCFDDMMLEFFFFPGSIIASEKPESACHVKCGNNEPQIFQLRPENGFDEEAISTTSDSKNTSENEDYRGAAATSVTCVQHD